MRLISDVKLPAEKDEVAIHTCDQGKTSFIANIAMNRFRTQTHEELQFSFSCKRNNIGNTGQRDLRLAFRCYEGKPSVEK